MNSHIASILLIVSSLGFPVVQAAADDRLSFGWQSVETLTPDESEHPIEQVAASSSQDRPTPAALPKIKSKDRNDQPMVREVNSILEVRDAIPLRQQSSQSSESGLSDTSRLVPDFLVDDPLTSMISRVVPSTLVVLGLAVLLLILMKRNSSVGQRVPSSESLRVIERIPIDRKSVLHLVATGSERYLVATDLNGVKSVTLVPNWTVEETESVEANFSPGAKSK